MTDEEILRLDIQGMSEKEALSVSLWILEKETEKSGKTARRAGALFLVGLVFYVLAMMTEISVLEYAVMGAASVVGILAFDSLQEWIRTKIIRKKLMNGTYKESPKEFLASMQRRAGK